ncbi:hypothetical protein [Aquamicrobium terrae]|uniref:Uncharacterized protein n=1 Tax=Aquamicrobium terrae TaxID=1324945 RepID=A0ABV2MV80_9HYPH
MTDKPVYTMRECVELSLMLVTVQIREERINSIEELYGLKRHFETVLDETSPARIEALEAENVRLRAALEPFARHADGRKSKGLLGGVIFTQPALLAARCALEGGNEDG